MEARLRRLSALSILALACLALPPAASGGEWFDLGERRTEFIHCGDDSSATDVEAFPPDAFGVFPLGSWVFEEFREVGCDQLRWPDQVCWNNAHVRSFRIEFNDGGCGCGGYVARPSTLTLAYDPAIVAARGLNEADLRLAYNDPSTRGWRPVLGAIPDVEANTFTVSWGGDILGVREYAIVTSAFVPVVPQTWSRIKSLLGD
jgi:hypothetical protein